MAHARALSALALTLVVLPAVTGICYCGLGCGRRKGCEWHELDRMLCFDNESAAECNRANWELTDMITSLGKNADLYLETQAISHPEALTPAGASFLRTKLSFAIETGKPVADCEAGLATDTRVQGTRTHCYSPELLGQCALVAAAADPYAIQIHEKLRTAILDDPKSVQFGFADPTEALDRNVLGVALEFADMIQMRGAIATANIRCESYDSTMEDLNVASPLASSVRAAFWSAIGAALLLATLL